MKKLLLVGGIEDIGKFQMRIWPLWSEEWAGWGIEVGCFGFECNWRVGLWPGKMVVLREM